MNNRLKTFLQYLAILSLAGVLVWYSLKGITPEGDQSKWTYILHTWQVADKGWLMLMALLAMASHVVRAERWRMLVEPTGHSTTLYHSFLALMIGYLVNLVIPRGGEVSRCYNLYKLDCCPMDKTFGTVVAERAIDLLCFVLILAAAFLVESDKLFGFLRSFAVWPVVGTSRFVFLAVLLTVLLATGFLLYRLVKGNKKMKLKIIRLWRGFKTGLLTVLRLKNHNLFYLHTALIWLLYFGMSYTVLKAFNETSHLGWGAVMALFAIGSVAMIIPLPGGTGSYHTLVPAGLVFLYQIPKADAVAFTFVFHAWQTLIMIAAGAFAIFSAYLIIRLRERKTG